MASDKRGLDLATPQEDRAWMHMSYDDASLPDAGLGLCCIGAAMYGPGRCTCWVEVFDMEQQPPRADELPVEGEQCADCAYRNDSPERRNDPDHAGDEAGLEQLVRTGSPFWCHQGIRRPDRFEHRPQDCTVADLDEWAAEQGVERVTVIPGKVMQYRPPVIDGVPYRADGSPAFVCAGWSARRRALLT